MENNGRAICKDKNGNIWFRTIAGAVRYNPYDDVPNRVEALTHITDIVVNGKLQEMWNSYSEINRKNNSENDHELEFDQNNLQFRFAGIHFSIPEKIKYQYRLTGFDEKWSDLTDHNSVNYTNLEPGDYTFLVRASNHEGIWNKEPVEFHFTILPPYWQTWWFYLLQILFFGILLIASFYFKKKDSGSRLAKILTFVCLAVILEFVNYNISPYIEQYISNSAPYIKIASNIMLGALISPFEELVKKVLWRG
jgi:hypothetical protein